MVALQVLVLSVQVRILVRLQERVGIPTLFFFCISTPLLFYYRHDIEPPHPHLNQQLIPITTIVDTSAIATIYSYYKYYSYYKHYPTPPTRPPKHIYTKKSDLAMRPDFVSFFAYA